MGEAPQMHHEHVHKKHGMCVFLMLGLMLALVSTMWCCCFGRARCERACSSPGAEYVRLVSDGESDDDEAFYQPAAKLVVPAAMAAAPAPEFVSVVEPVAPPPSNGA